MYLLHVQEKSVHLAVVSEAVTVVVRVAGTGVVGATAGVRFRWVC